MRGGWSWPGAVALVLAACVGIGWTVAAIAVVTSDDPGGTGAVVIYVLGATLAGGVIHWLGGTTTARHRKEEDQ